MPGIIDCVIVWLLVQWLCTQGEGPTVFKTFAGHTKLQPQSPKDSPFESIHSFTVGMGSKDN